VHSCRRSEEPDSIVEHGGRPGKHAGTSRRRAGTSRRQAGRALGYHQDGDARLTFVDGTQLPCSRNYRPGLT